VLFIGIAAYVYGIIINKKKLSVKLCAVFIILMHVLLVSHEILSYKHMNLERQYFSDFITSKYSNLAIVSDEGKHLPKLLLSPLKSVVEDTSVRTRHGKLVNIATFEIYKYGHDGLKVGVYKRKEKPHLLEVFLFNSPSPYKYRDNHLSSIHNQDVVESINLLICKKERC
jgi:hypothetical protein